MDHHGKKSGRAQLAKPRRTRKPRIDIMIRRLEKAGKHVTSVTTPEGFTLNLGQPTAADRTNNDLDKWLAKNNAH